MPAQPITMQQIRRIIQLLKNGFSERSIKKQTGVSRPTVSLYKKRLEQLDQTYEQLLLLTDEELSNLVLEPVQDKIYQEKRYQDLQEQLSKYSNELKRVGVTRQLLWEEYKQSYPDGYGYSQFCLYLQSQSKIDEATMHFLHTPGKTMQVDFAGKTMKCKKPNGEIVSYQIFIATLPFSGYAYIEAVQSQNQTDFVNCMQHALVYFGGVPQCIVPDNLKSCVTKADKYEPVLTELMDQFCIHYDTAIMPARVVKPKDKPSVEKGVHLAYQRVYAPMREMEFSSLREVNNQILIQLEKHHNRTFRNTDQSRKELFIQMEKQTLKPLPTELFQIKKRVNAKVQPNYHVVLGEDWHYYSVPYQYLGKQTVIVYTTGTVEIYYENKRLAIHPRVPGHNGYTTEPSHRKPNHEIMVKRNEWSGDYFRKWASNLSSDIVPAIDKLLQNRQYIEQTYKACLGVLTLSKKYGTDRLAKACQMAIKANAVKYSVISGILKNNRDKLIQPGSPPPDLFGDHENIRGPESFDL